MYSLVYSVSVLYGIVYFKLILTVYTFGLYMYLPWKNGAKYLYARIGPNPLYWPTNNSEKNIGNPITNTIKIYGTRNAPVQWCYTPRIQVRDGYSRVAEQIDKIANVLRYRSG